MLRRPLLLAATTLLFAFSACEPRVAGLVVVDASFFRGQYGAWVADIDVRAVEASGRAIGRHCVSVFWFPPGSDLAALQRSASYGGAYESGVACFDDRLEDGDSRRVRLTTKRTDIPGLARVRVQGLVGSDISFEDFTTP